MLSIMIHFFLVSYNCEIANEAPFCLSKSVTLRSPWRTNLKISILVHWLANFFSVNILFCPWPVRSLCCRADGDTALSRRGF